MKPDQKWEGIPQRSRLCSSPIGVGTADVESLTSHLMCMARAHGVSVRYLLSNEIYCDKREGGPMPWANWMVRASTINGTGAEASRVVEILARMTCRDDLQYLTLLPYQALLAPRPHVLKRHRAWCPECMEAMREGNTPIYEKLAWVMVPSDLCPIHNQPLEAKCPHCGAAQRILAANSVPGFCNNCIRWLGGHRVPYDGELSGESLWLANAIRELVAALPHVDVDRLIANYRAAVVRCANERFGGSIRALSRSGANYTRILAYFRDGKTVPISLLLKGAYELDLSIGKLSAPQAPGSPQELQILVHIIDSKIQPHYSAKIRRELLQRELDSAAPRSPQDIASSLGYSGTAQLWRADRGVYEELARKSIRTSRLPRGEEPLREIKAKAEQHLHSSLSQAFPRSIKGIAKEMGNLKEGTLRGWFPELCKAINLKRNNYKNDKCETELKRALYERPIPSLSEVAQRSGLTIAILLSRTPEDCRRLNQARKSEAPKTIKILRERVTPFLAQNPPMTGAEICRRLRVSWNSLKRRLPQLAEQIMQQTRAYQQQGCILRQMSAFDEVRKAVSDIQLEGEAPTAIRIAALVGNRYNDWSLQNDARKKALADLSAIPAPSGKVSENSKSKKILSLTKKATAG